MRTTSVLSLHCSSLLFGFLAASPAAADDTQLWLAFTTRTSLAGPLELHADTNARWIDGMRHVGHIQFRAMLGWRLPSKTLVSGGYSYVRADQLSGGTVFEHRPFQQLNVPLGKIGKAQLSTRTRFEQRLFSNFSGVTLRLRQQVSLAIPIDHASGLEVIVETEPFFVLNAPSGTDVPTGFHQIRTFAGINLPISPQIAIEAGYLNQHILPDGGRTNHNLSLTLATRF